MQRAPSNLEISWEVWVQKVVVTGRGTTLNQEVIEAPGRRGREKTGSEWQTLLDKPESGSYHDARPALTVRSQGFFFELGREREERR